MLNYLTVTLDLYDGSGQAATYGTAKFTPNATLTDVVDGALITQAPVTATFGPGGFPVVRLLQTDNPNVAPAAWKWQAAFSVNGSPPAMTFKLAAGPVNFTATNASPAVFTIPAETGFGDEGIPVGTGVQLAGGSLPAGFTAATTYYVVNPSGLTFELSATAGGFPIASTSTGSGTVTAASYQLSAVTTVQSAALTAQFLPLPAGTPTDGEVPVVSAVSPLALEWGSGGGGGGGDVSSVFTRTGDVTAQTGDYAVSQVTGAAPLASPVLTGSPTAPTQTTGDNSTKVATTAFVGTAVGVETTRAEAAEAALIPLSQKAAASGVATLDSGTKVPAAQLPSATNSALGGVELAGDLGGTASSPQVTSTHLASPLPSTQGGTGQDAATLAALLTVLLAAGGGTAGAFLAPKVSALTYGSTVAVNAALANVFTVTLTGATAQLSNPTNPVDGQVIRVLVTQDATGGRLLTYGTAYDFGTAGTPALTATAAAVDMLSFAYSAAKSAWLFMGAGFGF